MKKRYLKKKEDTLKGTGYDSKLEMDLHKTTLSEAIFHSVEHKVNYTIPHSYEPDFIYTKGDITYYIESKGRFLYSLSSGIYGKSSSPAQLIQATLFWSPSKLLANSRICTSS